MALICIFEKTNGAYNVKTLVYKRYKKKYKKDIKNFKIMEDI